MFGTTCMRRPGEVAVRLGYSSARRASRRAAGAPTRRARPTRRCRLDLLFKDRDAPPSSVPKRRRRQPNRRAEPASISWLPRSGRRRSAPGARTWVGQRVPRWIPRDNDLMPAVPASIRLDQPEDPSFVSSTVSGPNRFPGARETEERRSSIHPLAPRRYKLEAPASGSHPTPITDSLAGASSLSLHCNCSY